MTQTGAAPRVLHVAETLPGGVAAYLNELLPAQMARSGAGQVALLAPQDQFDSLSGSALQGLVRFPYPRSGRNAGALWSLARTLRQRVETWQPQLLHAHSSFAGAICRLRRSPVPLVYSAHGWAFSREGSALAGSAYRWIERALQSRADAIVAISEHEREAAIDAGIDASRLRTIRHGLHELTQPLPPRMRRSPDASLELLFIGRFDRQKGLDWLLATLATLPQHRIRLTVVGAPVVDTPPALTRVPGVRYLGWLRPDQITRQLDACDALVVPSRWEGFGLVALEAMRRAVAVVVSNRGALPEVVGDAGIVFDLDRPDDFAAMLLSLDRDRLIELGRRGQARFSALFSGERMVEETLSLYRQVLAGVQR